MFGQVPSPARVDVPRQRRSKADQPAPGHDCDPARPRCRDGTQTRHRIKAGSDGGPTGLGRALWTPIPNPASPEPKRSGSTWAGRAPIRPCGNTLGYRPKIGCGSPSIHSLVPHEHSGQRPSIHSLVPREHSGQRLRRSLALRDQAVVTTIDKLRPPFVVRWRSRSGSSGDRGLRPAAGALRRVTVLASSDATRSGTRLGPRPKTSCRRPFVVRWRLRSGTRVR